MARTASEKLKRIFFDVTSSRDRNMDLGTVTYDGESICVVPLDADGQALLQTFHPQRTLFETGQDGSPTSLSTVDPHPHA
eukprot:6911864-Pyramimonas_sp.AAC.1